MSTNYWQEKFKAACAALSVVAILFGCSAVNPRASYKERVLKRVADFKGVPETQENIERFKNGLKADFRETIGKSAAFDEKVDLLAGWIHYGVRTPAVRKRITELNVIIANEMETAEQRAQADADRGAQIVAAIVGVAIVSLVVVGAAAGAYAAAQRPVYPDDGYTSFGNYSIWRSGPFATVTSPSGRTYHCHTIGNFTSCN